MSSQTNLGDKPLNKSALYISIYGIIGTATWFIYEKFYIKDNWFMIIYSLFICLTFIYVLPAILNGNMWLTFTAQFFLTMFITLGFMLIVVLLGVIVVGESLNDKAISLIPFTIATIYATLLMRIVCERNKEINEESWINPFRIVIMNNQSLQQYVN